MIRCRACGFVSAKGSAFCGGCGRSLNGRLCPEGHLSPIGAAFCVRCGKGGLTQAARGTNLGWIPVLVAWSVSALAAYLFLRWAIWTLVRLAVLLLLGAAALHAACHLLDRLVPGLGRATWSLLAWIVRASGAFARGAARVVGGFGGGR